MTVRVGILGLGCMGNCHMGAYEKVKGARVEAVCDIDDKKRAGDIGVFGKRDLSGVRLYAEAKDLLGDAGLDVIDICLPTYLHAEFTCAALAAGKHVICEKPMARTSAECKKMVQAAKRSGKELFLAHCIRFWPQYVKAREIVLSGQHGSVLSARFCRISPKPTWSWKNWLHVSKWSGQAALDLHIHDVDFVQYLFGKPKAVRSAGMGLTAGGFDHIVTTYDYGKDKLIMAEGAWEYAPTFPFSMTFSIMMEDATLDMARDLSLTLYPAKGKPRPIRVLKGDGYGHELQHFADCIAQGRASEIVTPESATRSVQLAEAEIASAKSGKAVVVRF